MPGMDGRELARRVSADPRLHDTRIVMIGSVGLPFDPAEQRALRIVGFATKPIWRKQLLRVLRDALDDRGPASTRGDPHAEIKSRRILVVEDSAINAEVAAEILRNAGYAFTLVEDGIEAIAAVERERFDLVLMDCQLPRMDGYEATQRVRALEASGALGDRARLPILALTASATKGDLDRSRDAGMDGHVAKPVDARRLLSAIARALRPRGSHPPPAESSPEALPATTAQVANLGTTLERLQGSRELLGRLIGHFAESTGETREKLRVTVDSRDPTAASGAAHFLRGQAATFDADAVLGALKILEDAITERRWPAAAAAVGSVGHELDRLLGVLSVWREGC
jgi:two-component system sensor histidine kinase/response regulator